MSVRRRLTDPIWVLLAAASTLLSGCGENADTPKENIHSAPALNNAPKKVALLTGEGQNDARTHFNWQMNCQGCHHPNGEGNIARDIPPLKALEKFQRLPEGRAFLIQVPGMSRSKLSDEELTEIANWMMKEFATPQTREEWDPYSVEEVAELRRSPVTTGVRDYREKLMARLERADAS